MSLPTIATLPAKARAATRAARLPAAQDTAAIHGTGPRVGPLVRNGTGVSRPGPAFRAERLQT